MLISSNRSPSSSQTRSMTSRASVHRWHPGLEYRVTLLVAGLGLGWWLGWSLALQQGDPASALDGAQAALLHLAGHGQR